MAAARNSSIVLFFDLFSATLAKPASGRLDVIVEEEEERKRNSSYLHDQCQAEEAWRWEEAFSSFLPAQAKDRGPPMVPASF